MKNTEPPQAIGDVTSFTESLGSLLSATLLPNSGIFEGVDPVKKNPTQSVKSQNNCVTQKVVIEGYSNHYKTNFSSICFFNNPKQTNKS